MEKGEERKKQKIEKKRKSARPHFLC